MWQLLGMRFERKLGLDEVTVVRHYDGNNGLNAIIRGDPRTAIFRPREKMATNEGESSNNKKSNISKLWL